MNIGTFLNRGLSRSQLSIDDVGFKNMALEMLDEIIQYYWNYKNWKFKTKSLTIATVSGTEEYSLDKRIVNYPDILKHSFRGSVPVREIAYSPAQEFYRTHRFDIPNADPYQWRPGQVKGFSLNPTSASVIALVSSLTNYTTGTALLAKGSNRVVFTTSVLTQDMLGLWIRFGTDQIAYKLERRDFGSSTIFYLDQPYQGSDAPASTFVIGDIQQKATVSGFLVTSGQYAEEEVQLNGSTPVSTVNQFTSLVRISKSGATGGYITATSNTGAITNVVLDPGETETSVLTVKLYPIPVKTETLNMESGVKHPFMIKSSDSPLFPTQFHPLLLIDLQIKITEEWLKKEVSPTMLARRQALLNSMVDIDNSTVNWTIYQQSDYDSDYYRTNLPNNFPSQDYLVD